MRRRITTVAVLSVFLVVSLGGVAAASDMDVNYVSVGSFGPTGSRFRNIDFLLNGTPDTVDRTGYLECDDSSYVISLTTRSGRVAFSAGPQRDDPSASRGPGATLPTGLAEGDYTAKMSCEVTPAFRPELGPVVRRCVRVHVPGVDATSFEATRPAGGHLTVGCPLDLRSLLGDSVIFLRGSLIDTLLRLHLLAPVVVTTTTTSSTTTTTKPKTTPTTLKLVTTTSSSTTPTSMPCKVPKQLPPCKP